MDLFRQGLEPEVVRLDWAGSRIAVELWNDNPTSRRFLWEDTHRMGWSGGTLEGERPSDSFIEHIFIEHPLCASQALEQALGTRLNTEQNQRCPYTRDLRGCDRRMEEKGSPFKAFEFQKPAPQAIERIQGR